MIARKDQIPLGVNQFLLPSETRQPILKACSTIKLAIASQEYVILYVNVQT